MAERQPPTATILRFLAIFAIVTCLFGVIDVAPMHFGPKHIPWSEIPAALQGRLVRMLLIAGGVAIFLTLRGQGSIRKPGDNNPQK